MSCNKFDLLSNLHVQKFEHLTPIYNIDHCWGDGYSTSISIYGSGGGKDWCSSLRNEVSHTYT